MVYKNISIKNFRGIKSLEINDLSRVNILLGKNNCGKTSILEAIFLLTGINNPNLSLNVDLFRNLAHTDESDFRFLFYQLDYKNQPEISSELYEIDGTRKMKISPKNNLKKKENNKKSLSSNESLLSDVDSTISYDGLVFNSEIKRRHSKIQTIQTSISLERENNGIINFPVVREALFKDDFLAVYQNSMINNTDLYKILGNLKIEKKIGSIISGLKIIEQKISGIELLGGNMIYLDIGIERLIPMNLMGDGVIKFISVISNLERATNGILLVDEIDNGLHFSVLKQIWRIILELSIKNNVQLFITTHDKETLLYLNEVLEEGDYSEDTNVVSCYTISKGAEDNLNSYKYKTLSLKMALEMDVEMRGEF